MLTKGFLKPQISAKKIGKFQFWVGIFAGIFSAFVFSIYFNYSREIFRSLTLMMTLLILSPGEFMIYDIFFAALSVSLAFGITIIIWMTGRKKIKKQYYRIFTTGNIWLMIFVVLFLILRMGSTLTFVLYLNFGYDNHLDFIKDFWLILMLLPIFIFFYNWNYLRLMFRSKHWVSISILVYIFLTFVLYKTTSIDKNTLNKIYYSRNREKFNFIDDELEAYKRFYGVIIEDSTKAMLKKHYSDKTFNLVKKLKKAFATDTLVSLDTIVLEGIVVHNLNIQGIYKNRFTSADKDINWPFAKPWHIYNQIKRYEKKNGKESIEIKFLIDILNEMAIIFNAPEIDWDKKYKYSDADIKRYRYKKIYKSVAPDIERQLGEVFTRLRFDKDNKSYHNQLIRLDIEK